MSVFVRSRLTRLNRCTTLQQADALRAAVVIAVIFHDDEGTIMANAEQTLPRAYDVIVYGASGFTGRLVAEHLLGTYGATGEINWAMAGRSTGKLAEVRDLIGGPSNFPLIAADASDPASLKTMAESAKVIISTVGGPISFTARASWRPVPRPEPTMWTCVGNLPGWRR